MRPSSLLWAIKGFEPVILDVAQPADADFRAGNVLNGRESDYDYIFRIFCSRNL